MERDRKIDFIISSIVAVLSLIMLNVWSFVGVHPYAWDDVAVASGLMPQGAMLPGIGAYVAHLIFAIFPYTTALWLNGFVAKLVVAGCGFMAYWIFSGMMEMVSGFGARDWNRRVTAIRIASAASAFMFVCSDPMWHAAQGLTASTFVIALVVTTFYTFLRLISEASVKKAIITLTASGILCAESPIGWVVLLIGVLMAYGYLFNSQRVANESWGLFLDPVKLQRTKWLMTFVFIGALIFGILVESLAFAALDGLRANGITAGELPTRYAVTYFHLLIDAFDLAGVMLFVIVVIVPAVLTFLMIMPATDEDHYLSFKFSIIYFICASLAFLQLSPFDPLWHWSMFDSEKISKTLILFGSFVSAGTIAWGIFVLGVEIFCRDYHHIENIMFHLSNDEDEPYERPNRDNIKSVKLTSGRLSMLVVPLILLVIVFWGRRLPEDRRLNEIIGEYLNETIIESAGTKFIFTDGSYDSALRIAARRLGTEVAPVSVMGGASHRDQYLRQLRATDFEDRMTLEAGASEALRTWVLAKSERLSDISVQVAFELFRLNRHLNPIVYGLLVRPTGGDMADAKASVERCHRLADKIVAVHEDGTWRHAKDKYLKDRFLFAQFRLAVMSRLRAINLDAQKRVKESIEEIAYSDRLNMNNPSLVKILKRMDWVRRQSGEALTPREGLEVAMKRADFVMARRYAMPVLKEDVDEPNANFAMGMSYYAEEQFAKAEEYLKRVLKRNANEPAVYNNLALVCMKTGRLEEAEKNANKALEFMPNSPEIKDTLKQIRKLKEDRKSPLEKFREKKNIK